MRILRLTAAFTVLTALVGLPAAAHGADPQPRWQLSDSQLPVPLFRSVLLKLDDHRVMIIGGGSTRTGPADNRRVFAYDVDTRTFSELASLPAAKTATDVQGDPQSITTGMGAGVLADGSVVVAGGQLDTGDTALNAHNILSYRYFPGQDRWVRTGDLPEPQLLFAIPSTLLGDGRLFVPGSGDPRIAEPAGFGSRKAFVYDPDAVTTVERVDPVTGDPSGGTRRVRGAWDYTRTTDGAESDMSQAHFYGNAVRLADGRVVVAGGQTRQGNVSNMATHTEFFDPTTGEWTRGPNLPSVPGEDDQHENTHGGRSLGICMTVVPGGDVVIAGGAASSDGTPIFGDTYFTRSSILTLVPAANPGDSTIRVEPTTIPSGPDNGNLHGDAGRAHVSCYLTGDGRVMFAGGQSTAEDLYDTYVYNPVNGAIKRGADLPHGVAQWAVDAGYPAGYQTARMGQISIAMRASLLVFHSGTTFVNLGGYNATTDANGVFGLRRAEQLDL